MTSQLKVDRISPATGSEIIIDGFESGGGGPSAVKIFESSGTWTNPGVSMIMVEVQGAGGSGDNEQTYRRSGASGGYVRKLIDVTSISSATITVGSGGGYVSAISATKNSGGDSQWSDGTNTLTGGGGQANGTSFSLGGTATGGDINIVGQRGESNSYSGGGDSILGFGASSTYYNDLPDPDGVIPSGYGAGGTSGTGAANPFGGGQGGNGIVIVTEY